MRLAEHHPFPRSAAYPDEPITALGTIQHLADKPKRALRVPARTGRVR
jgi:hypothetical protein